MSELTWKWIDANKQKPPTLVVVIVDGGIAYWSGEKWISEQGRDSGRPITWRVSWWTPIPDSPPAPAPQPAESGDLIERLQAAKETLVDAQDYDGGSAVRDAID